ncbi:calcium-binding protein [Caulobacter vibrioides]|uniref:Calcium-binding protein n=1 Tax=Caulobacter vibrioides TaxID=155892 RepID=A0A290MM10_CAUVI|nr:calcium-binding protein [Caulobacter vibrioides]ATC33051.1 calcium-binding protein [Caulobacter vibrioides]
MADFTGTAGDDMFQGGADIDTARGGGGNDLLSGGGGNDALYGDDGADTLHGDDGEDYLYGGGTNNSDGYVDKLYGGNGFDRLYAGIGDQLDGGTDGAQGDYAYLNLTNLSASVILDLKAAGVQSFAGGGSLVNIEQLEMWSGAGSDRIKGGAVDDVIHGGGGHDALYGAGGGDHLYGQGDNDTLRGEGGADILRGDAGHDRLIGGEGDDALTGDQDLAGTGDGADQLDGGAGNDYLYGNAGDDILIGGTGDDIMTGGAGADRFAFSGLGQGNDLVRDFSKAQDRFDLDGKAFTAATSDGNGGTLLTWDGGKIQVEKVTGTLAEFNALVTNGANTLVRLTNAFDNLMRYAPATDADRAYVQGLTDKVVAGQLTEANALKAIINVADATSAVATTSYAFFTGGTPSELGMDYLVSPIGPNPNNLNSAYYQTFNTENRYINFAVNLGRDGAGKDAFSTEYGNKSLFEATRTAYTKIFGTAPTDAKVHVLIDDRADYFAAYGKTDIGTKAAMVGWLLAEAMKADVGQFANASNAYFTDLADGAPFAVDLIGTYGKPEYNL